MKNKRQPLSYFIEFVKFASGFALILAIALLALHMAMAAQ
jgi:hypothetical protein